MKYEIIYRKIITTLTTKFYDQIYRSKIYHATLKTKFTWWARSVSRIMIKSPSVYLRPCTIAAPGIWNNDIKTHRNPTRASRSVTVCYSLSLAWTQCNPRVEKSMTFPTHPDASQPRCILMVCTLLRVSLGKLWVKVMPNSSFAARSIRNCKEIDQKQSNETVKYISNIEKNKSPSKLKSLEGKRIENTRSYKDQSKGFDIQDSAITNLKN